MKNPRPAATRQNTLIPEQHLDENGNTLRMPNEAHMQHVMSPLREVDASKPYSRPTPVGKVGRGHTAVKRFYSFTAEQLALFSHCYERLYVGHASSMSAIDSCFDTTGNWQIDGVRIGSFSRLIWIAEPDEQKIVSRFFSLILKTAKKNIS